MDADGSVSEVQAARLFKTSEVLLWDNAHNDLVRKTSRDDGSEVPYSSFLDDPDNILSGNPRQEIKEDITLYLELAQEMGALGLPVSFSTNKEKRKSSAREKKKVKSLVKDIHPSLLNLGSKLELTVKSQDLTSTNNTEGSLSSLTGQHKLSNFCDVALDNDANDAADFASMVVEKSEICTEQLYNVNDMPISAVGIDRESINSTSTIVSAHPVCLFSKNLDSTTVENACVVPTSGDQFNTKLENATAICGSSLDPSRHFDFESNEMKVPDSYCLDYVEPIRMNFFSTKCDNCKCPDDLSYWTVVWDNYYMRNYYYNIHSKESTWESPLCSDCSAISSTSAEAHVVTNIYGTGKDFTSRIFEDTDPSSCQSMDSFSEATNHDKLPFQPNGETTCRFNHESGKLASESKLFSTSDCLHQIDGHHRDVTSSYGDCILPFQLPSCGSKSKCVDRKPNKCYSDDTLKSSKSLMDMVQTDDDPVSTKNKDTKRIESQHKIKQNKEGFTLYQEMEGLSSKIMKYWCQRYSLFSKFDMGIKMDEEGWFSVTPEVIAQHHAERCFGGTVIDCFTGVGGNAIQFARKSCHVIAIDIDPFKIDYALHNATIYGVQDNIDFVLGDFFQLASNLKGDAVFLSPPWGGPDYSKTETFDLLMLKPHDGYFLFKIACLVAPKVIMFLPRNVSVDQLVELSQLVHPPLELEVERNYLNGKLKAITAYFSDTSC